MQKAEGRRQKSTFCILPSAFCLCIALLASCTRGPQPPDVSTYGDLDPDVASLLTDETAAVNAARSDAGRWSSLGMALEANGLLTHAESAYSTALQLSDREAQWYYRRAVLRARRGADEDALADLNRAIALSPGYAPAHWRRGLWLLDRGDTAGARTAFEAAARIAPSDPAGPTGLALVHLATGDNADAAAVLEKLLAATPGDRYALQLLGTAYRRLGREDEARFALIVGSSGQPAWSDPWSDQVNKYRRGFAAMLKEATQLGVERKFDEAIALLTQLTKTRPDDKALRVYLGGMYAAAGKIDQARAILDPIIAADPSQFDATMHLASGYLFSGDLDTAADYAARALALRPASVDAAKLRGMVHWQQGRTREAEALFEAAAAADPRDPMPHLWIGMILGQQARYVDARRRFEAALSRNPLLGDALIGVADTFAATGQWNAAKVALERARQAEPENPRLAAAHDRIFTAAKSAR